MIQQILKTLTEKAPELGTIALALLVLILVVFLLSRIEEVREQWLKFRCMTRNYIGADFGWRRLLLLLIFSFLVAYTASARFAPGTSFRAHLSLFLLIAATIFLYNLASGSPMLRRVFAPAAGGQWRRTRKIQTAAIITKLNRHWVEGDRGPAHALKLASDVLTVIVSHVRDWRGSHGKEEDVFANLLLIKGDDLVVVARDHALQSASYSRPIPKAYRRELLVAGRAIAELKPWSTGNVHREYPSTPRDKPYKSVLGIPLMSSGGVEAIGALSIDSIRPYFFQGFSPGRLEEQLETTLRPYLALLTLTLEVLVSQVSDELADKALGSLGAPTNTETSGG